jgi:8-oxo-dGTP diphosphatase
VVEPLLLSTAPGCRTDRGGGLAGRRGIFAPFSGLLPLTEKARRGAVDPEDTERRAAEARVQAILYTFWQGQAARLVRVLNEHRADLRAVQIERQAGKVTKAGSFDITLDWADETGQLQALLGPLFQEIFDGAAEQALAPLQKMGVNLSWETYDKMAASAAQYYQHDFLKDLTESTKRQLGKAISQWIESDQDFDALVRQVRKLVPTKPYPGLRDRAQLIAATEVTRVYTQARHASWTAAGLKNQVWRTANDELVCPWCGPLGLANEGKGAVGTIEGGFLHPETGQKIMAPPAHPACRCWCVSDTAELEALAQQMPAPKTLTPKPPKAVKPKVVKPKRPASLISIKPDVPWAGSMLPQDAEAWSKGTYFASDTFYYKAPTHSWNKVKIGGIAPQVSANVNLGSSPVVTVHSESAKPTNESAHVVVPVKLRVTNPVLCKSAEDLKKLVKKLNGGKAPAPGENIASLLQGSGYDAVVWQTGPGGSVTQVEVLSPHSATVMVNRYGKPATSKWKPPKAKKALVGLPEPMPEPVVAPALAQPPAPVTSVTEVSTPALASKPGKATPIFTIDEWGIDHAALLSKDLHAPESVWGTAGKGAHSYGGVIFDTQGRVLLRRPKGDYGGYVWTFPKGGLDKDEHPLTAALREVEQETGHMGQVIGLVPGAHGGQASKTHMFLMRTVGYDPTKMDDETAELRWATKEEAEALIGETKTITGKKRDLRILHSAYDEFGKLQDIKYRYEVKNSVAALPPAPVKPKLAPVTVALSSSFPFEIDGLKKLNINLGGAHSKQVFEAPDGSRWMFKPQDEWRAQIDRTIYEMAVAVGHDAAETYVISVGGRAGSIQRLYPDVGGDFYSVDDSIG